MSSPASELRNTAKVLSEVRLKCLEGTFLWIDFLVAQEFLAAQGLALDAQGFLAAQGLALRD